VKSKPGFGYAHPAAAEPIQQLIESHDPQPKGHQLSNILKSILEAVMSKTKLDKTEKALLADFEAGQFKSVTTAARKKTDQGCS